MGKIFYIMGKSASGKDTVYHRLCDDKSLGLHTVTLYTTRPRREGETDGVEYHFCLLYTSCRRKRSKYSTWGVRSQE